MSGRSGALYERPITSDRAGRVPELLIREGVTLREALAAGMVTIRAVAVAYYGGDVQAARAAIYGK